VCAPPSTRSQLPAAQGPRLSPGGTVGSLCPSTPRGRALACCWSGVAPVTSGRAESSTQRSCGPGGGPQSRSGSRPSCSPPSDGGRRVREPAKERRVATVRRCSVRPDPQRRPPQAVPRAHPRLEARRKVDTGGPWWSGTTMPLSSPWSRWTGSASTSSSQCLSIRTGPRPSASDRAGTCGRGRQERQTPGDASRANVPDVESSWARRMTCWTAPLVTPSSRAIVSSDSPECVRR
jgi:hypothetical protein